MKKLPFLKIIKLALLGLETSLLFYLVTSLTAWAACYEPWRWGQGWRGTPCPPCPPCPPPPPWAGRAGSSGCGREVTAWWTLPQTLKRLSVRHSQQPILPQHGITTVSKLFFITDIATYRLNQPRGQIIWNALYGGKVETGLLLQSFSSIQGMDTRPAIYRKIPT